MASDLSAYLGNKICRWLNGDAAMPSVPAGLYVAIFNGNPKASGTEVGATINTTSGQKRQHVTFTTLASGADHLMTSSIAADWGASVGATTMSYLALFDDVAAGNLLASKAIAGGAVPIQVGTGVKFLAGAITFNVGSDT